jgi:hypothetical protein
VRRDLKKAIRLLREANENIWEARVLLKDYDAMVNTTEVAIPYGIDILAEELGATPKTTESPFGGKDTSFEIEGIKFIEYATERK